MIAIISDVHGNYPALLAVLKEIDELNCQQIISLGDVSGYYCQINECINEFRKRNIINVMGNHDSYLLGYGNCPRSSTVNQCIDYQKKILTQENKLYLSNSQTKLELEWLSARHGGWTDALDEYIEAFNFEIALKDKKLIHCSGHSHRQFQEKCGEYIYFNPGSVGQPRDGDPRAAFAIINHDQLHLKRVEYDIDSIANEMKKAGFEERIFSCLYRGTRIGG